MRRVENPGTLLIRADANATIGAGHVMRCLALAQACQDAQGSVVFAASEIPKSLEQRLWDEHFEVIRLPATENTARDIGAVIEVAQNRKPAWIVLDGERFKAEYVNALKECGHRVLVLDDFGHSCAHRADLILNQNLGATRAEYSWCQDESRLLLGTKYLLLRREFSAIRPSGETTNKARRVLISFGGSDPDGLTERALSAIGAEAGLDITVVIGSGNPQASRLLQQTRPAVTVLVDPPRMPELMAQSDLVVIIAGGTLWETLFCGCVVLSYSRNSLQQRVISELAEKGAVRDMGMIANFDPDALSAAIRELADSQSARHRMRAAARSIVEPGGAQRVVQKMMEAG